MGKLVRLLLIGAVLAVAYFAAMYALGGWYWPCDEKIAAWNPLGPPSARACK